MVLGLDVKPAAGDEIELSFEEVDVFFLVVHELLEQIARHIIANRMAVRRRLLIERAGRDFGGEIAIKHLLDVLADMQRIEHLHIRKAVKKDDALDQLVGMLHLFDGLFAPLLGQRLVAPIVEQTVMQPVLIDGSQFVPQRLIEEIEDTGLASHLFAPRSNLIRTALNHAERGGWEIIAAAIRLGSPPGDEWLGALAMDQERSVRSWLGRFGSTSTVMRPRRP